MAFGGHSRNPGCSLTGRAAAGSEAGGGAFKDSLCGHWRPQNCDGSSLGESESEAEVRAPGKEWPQPRERGAGRHREEGRRSRGEPGSCCSRRVKGAVKGAGGNTGSFAPDESSVESGRERGEGAKWDPRRGASCGL